MKPLYPLTSLVGATVKCRGVAVGLLLTVEGLAVEAGIPAQLDASKLPPPASIQVEFQRDIRPLLEGHCLKCHSGDRPKGNFRLTSREAALKGGFEGGDIVVGNSGRSPLIYYVARLVPDLEMPPDDRGTPLNPSEVGVLRAWIDQGLVWPETTNEPATTAEGNLTVGWTGVSGDRQKFKELNWQPDGWNGGLEQFSLEHRPDADTRVKVDGTLLRDDYKLTLSAERNNVGFTRFGWEQFRRYYDDTGGYDPNLGVGPFSLGRDLFMDTGRAWADFGLTLPHWPRLVLGYEYQYRDGEKSTLQWGPVSNNSEIRNVFPASKEVDEVTHVLKFHIDHELAGITLEDNFRGEWYRLNTYRANDSSFSPSTGNFALTRADESQKYFQGANTVYLQKQFTEWFTASGGYLFSKLNSDASVSVSTANAAALEPIFFAPGWQAPNIQLERDSHVFSVSTLLGAWQGLSLYAGVQNEWTRQQSLGAADVSIAAPFAPFLFPIDPERFHSDLDRSVFSQDVGVRFTKLPFTTIFVEARFSETREGQFEEEVGGLTPFLRQTDISDNLRDWRAGFNTSPWKRLELSGSYRNWDKESDYNHLRKEVFGLTYPGYPGFLLWRDVQSQEAQGRISMALTSWFKAALGYSWLDSVYRNATGPVADPIGGVPGGITSGGSLVAGRYQAHTPSLNLTMTPWQRLVFSGTFSYQNASTVTFSQDNPSIVPYRGDIYSFMGTVSYLLNPKTDLWAGYTMSLGDFSQEQLQAGLPLGIKYEQHAVYAGLKRRISDRVSASIQYRYYLYHEPSSANVNDFAAHAVYATVGWRLP